MTSDAEQPAPAGTSGGEEMVLEKPDPAQIRQFVTTIKSAEQQVGEHVIRGLQDGDTVAVLTTVVVDPQGGQRLVSVALDESMLEHARRALHDAQRDREEDVPCVGFHCFTRRKQSTDCETGEDGDAAS